MTDCSRFCDNTIQDIYHFREIRVHLIFIIYLTWLSFDWSSFTLSFPRWIPFDLYRPWKLTMTRIPFLLLNLTLNGKYIFLRIRDAYTSPWYVDLCSSISISNTAWSVKRKQVLTLPHLSLSLPTTLSNVWVNSKRYHPRGKFQKSSNPGPLGNIFVSNPRRPGFPGPLIRHSENKYVT